MSEIIRRPSANRDLVDIFRHYAHEAGMRVADRFFVQAEATFARLARMPNLGTRYEPDEPLYADMRYFPISRFRKYLVFYRPVPRRHRGIARAARGTRHRWHPGGGIRRGGGCRRGTGRKGKRILIVSHAILSRNGDAGRINN